MFRIFRITLLIVVFCFPLKIFAQEKDVVHFTAFSLAHNQCKDFTVVQDKQGVQLAYKLWFGGYLTAFGSILRSDGDFLKGIEMTQVMDWIKKYCSEHQEAYFSEVSEELVTNIGALRRTVEEVDAKSNLKNQSD